MDGETAKLLNEIKAFLKRASISPGHFGRLAVKNGNLVKRLERGGTVTLPTAAKIRAYINGK